MGQIKIKDHLSPAEAEVGAELGNNVFVMMINYFNKLVCDDNKLQLIIIDDIHQ